MIAAVVLASLLPASAAARRASHVRAAARCDRCGKSDGDTCRDPRRNLAHRARGALPRGLRRLACAGRPPHRLRLGPRRESGGLRGGHAHGRSPAADTQPAEGRSSACLVARRALDRLAGRSARRCRSLRHAGGRFTKAAARRRGRRRRRSRVVAERGAGRLFVEPRRQAALGGAGGRRRATATRGGSWEGTRPLGRRQERVWRSPVTRLETPTGYSISRTAARASSREAPAGTRGPIGRRAASGSHSRARQRGAPRSGSSATTAGRPVRWKTRKVSRTRTGLGRTAHSRRARTSGYPTSISVHQRVSSSFRPDAASAWVSHRLRRIVATARS